MALQPYMPNVKVFSGTDLANMFQQARNLARGKSPTGTPQSEADGQKYLTLILPDRNMRRISTARPNAMARTAVEGILNILPLPSKYVVGIALNDKLTTAAPEQLIKAIPFFGFLAGMAYVGHTVVIFEGHPTAFEEGVRGADQLLVDREMIPFLNPHWVEIAFSVMRTPRIDVYNRGDGKVERIEPSERDVKSMPASTSIQLRLRANAWKKVGNLENALRDLDLAIQQDTQNPHLYIERGIVRRLKGTIEAAMSDFETAIKLAPANAFAFRERGTTYTHAKQWQQAINDLSRSIQLNPSDYSAYCQRAWAYLNLKEWKRAYSDSSKAIELDASIPDAWNHRSTARRGLNDYIGAIEDAKQALKLRPKYHYAYLSMTDAMLFMRDYDGAIETAKMGLELIQSLYMSGELDKEEWINSIGALMAMRDGAAKLKAGKQSNPAPANPSPVKANSALEITRKAHVFYKEKNYKSAIQEATRALSIDPNFVAALEIRCFARMAKNDTRGALADANKIIEAAKTKHELALAYNLRGLVHEKMQKSKEALEDFRKAVNADTDFINAQENLARMQSKIRRR
jgi:tetratricopeptide (TPR) repeat protein